MIKSVFINGFIGFYFFGHSNTAAINVITANPAKSMVLFFAGVVVVVLVFVPPIIGFKNPAIPLPIWLAPAAKSFIGY
jgi:hypothetical protein